MNTLSHKVIRASAGSGKTFNLARHYLTLLHLGANPAHILATTFTRAAAGEIRDRILQWLVSAAADPDALDKLRSDTRLELTQQRVEQLFDTLLPTLPSLPIGTIDATFQRMASLFSLELGMPDAPVMLDERSALATDLRLRAIQRLLGQNHSDEELDTLVRWLRHLSTGQAKRSVSQAIADVAEETHGVWADADNPDLWYFTQPRTRLEQAQLEQAADTLHATETSLPQNKSGGPNKNFANAWSSLLHAARIGDWDLVLNNGLALKVWNDETTYHRAEIPTDIADAVRPLLDHARAVIARDYDWRTKANAHFLQQFDAAWKQITAEQGVALYAEPTTRLSRKLADPTQDWITDLYFRLDARIDHLLLDEFQDTSRQQWDVLEPLVDELLAHGSADISGRSLFAVGDPKQAIYGWRGGDVRIFSHLAHRVEQTGSPTADLKTIYRCSPCVLELVNRVFTHAHQAEIYANTAATDAVTQWVADYQEHIPADPDRPGYASVECTSPGEDAHHAHIHTVALKIAQLHRTMPQRSIGVLVSKRKTANEIILALRALDVDASDQGGVPITGDPAVEAILSALTLADHPNDQPARFHLRNSPAAQAVRLPENDAEIEAWASRTRSRILRHGFGRLIQQWVTPLAPQCDPQRWHRLTQLLDLAQRYDAQTSAQPEPPALRPTRFVEHIRTASIEDPSASPVRVLTIHAAKGLEYDAVVLPDLDQRWSTRGNLIFRRDAESGDLQQIAVRPPEKILAFFPDMQQLAEASDTDDTLERLCLLYVALTRARFGLYLMLKPVAPTTSKDGYSSEGTTNRSHASLIRQTLNITLQADHEPSTYLEIGDPDWYTKAPLKPISATPTPQTLSLILKPGQTIASTRASTLQTSITQLFQQQRSSGARARGDAVHALMEAVTFLDDHKPDWLHDDETALETLRNAGIPCDQPEPVARWIAEARQALASPQIQTLMTRRGASHLHHELPFATTLENGSLQSGRIDRLVVWHENDTPVRAEVIDFKTDRISDTPEDRAATIHHHARQLRSYAHAAALLLGLTTNEIKAHLVMTHPGITLEIDLEAPDASS